MANKIQLKRGIKSRLSTLSAGEPAFTTDTRELFLGTGSGNVNMSGNKWYNRTALSGTRTSTTYTYSACPLVKLGDMYLNTTTGGVYECTTSGSSTGAKWTYRGCIKGANGEVEVDLYPDASSSNPISNEWVTNQHSSLEGFLVNCICRALPTFSANVKQSITKLVQDRYKFIDVAPPVNGRMHIYLASGSDYVYPSSTILYINFEEIGMFSAYADMLDTGIGYIQDHDTGKVWEIQIYGGGASSPIVTNEALIEITPTGCYLLCSW
ncbi:MAG: hypothetical protein IJG06_05045 [Clostridia bacterium]|nr:hypothetical protein [Clostridia bacterium]